MTDGTRRLLANSPFPVLEVDALTHEAAAAVPAVRGRLGPEDERKIAAALGLFDASVDTDELAERIALERPARVTPIMFEYELIERAKATPRKVVLPEGEDERVLRAAEILLRRGVCDLTILGAREAVDGAEIVDPLESPLLDEFASIYYDLRKHKGITEELAYDRVANPSYFGTLLVQTGRADGMVSGAAHTTADTIRPAFEIIKAREGVSVVSSVFLMCLADRVLVYGDCAVNPKPEAGQLADIAISSAETAAVFGIEPRIAMLSYSTGESGKGEDVDRVRRGDRGGARAAARPEGRGADPVRRRRGRGGRRAEAAGQRGRGPRDRVRLPGPGGGERRLQGRPALGRRRRDRAGPAGAAQAGQRPEPRLHGHGHRQHRGHHRYPGFDALKQNCTEVKKNSPRSSSSRCSAAHAAASPSTSAGLASR